ncbi:MAG: PAS domain S-box protein [Gallionella sp.]
MRNLLLEQCRCRFQRYSGLRARLLLLLILTLLPAYTFILYSVFEARQEAAAYARNNALSLTRMIELEQNELFETIRQQLIDFSQLQFVRNPGLAKKCDQTFASLLKLHPLYNNLGVIYPDGSLRCSALPPNNKLNFSDRGYFRAAMSTRAFAIGDYIIDRVTGKSSINLAYPILTATGHPQAVVFIALSLGALSARLLKTSVLPQGSTISIVDEHGKILARQPDPEKWVGRLLPEKAAIRTMLALKQEGSLLAPGIDGKQRMFVYAPLDTATTNPAYFSMGIPTSAIYAGARQLFVRALLLMVLVTAVVIVAAWFGGKALVLQPMAKLMRAARQIGQGILGTRTGLPHTSGEFGQLAQSIDDMAASLQAQQSETARANARFANIIALSEDAIISVDENQRILIFNQGAEKIFAYTAAEMIGQPLDKLLPERLAEVHREHMRQFATESVAVRDMNRRPGVFGRRKDGSEFFAEARISRMMDNGKPIFTVYLRDISERRRTEQALLQKEQLLTMVGAMAKVGGWELDPLTQKVLWNDVVAGIFGMDPKEHINVETGLRPYQGESRTAIEAAIQNAMAYGQPFDLKLEIVTAGGERKWVRAIAQAIKKDGEVVKVWGSVQDITEHKHAEEEIRQLNANLEQRILERTTELVSANKELEAFSYSVSHDLRSPLRSIDGFSQALLEDYADQLDNQGKDYLNRVRAATQRMGELIDDMLKLSRVTRVEMQRKPVDLSALATEVLAGLQNDEPERKVDCRVEPGLVAQGDDQLLRVALENLLGNAWKFTGKTANAKIEFGSTLGTDGDRLFFVRDNGAGFDMTYADKLFGVFQRLHQVNEFPGTGVGLATVLRIARRHGGQVRGAGVPGQGATFYFTLHD